MGIQDGTNLTSVFQNADQADNLKDVMSVAKKVSAPMMAQVENL